MTYSLVACDLGALATQAYANPTYGPDGLALLRDGASPEEVVAQLTAADDGRDERQLGVVDGQGRSASFTGSACMDWAGGRTGHCYAAQGNLLFSGETVDALAASFEASAGGTLAERLLEALAAAQLAGGDRRGQQSAAILVVERDGGYAGLTDTIVDLRVDDSPQPLVELSRLYEIHLRIYGKTPREDWLRVDPTLESELTSRLAALGYDAPLGEALREWAGTENLEERLDGTSDVDPVLLEALRAASP